MTLSIIILGLITFGVIWFTWEFCMIDFFSGPPVGETFWWGLFKALDDKVEADKAAEKSLHKNEIPDLGELPKTHFRCVDKRSDITSNGVCSNQSCSAPVNPNYVYKIKDS